MKNFKQPKLYLFIRQDEGKAIFLGMITPHEALRKAHKMAKSYLFSEKRRNRTQIAIQNDHENIACVYAERIGGVVKLTHEIEPFYKVSAKYNW